MARHGNTTGNVEWVAEESTDKMQQAGRERRNVQVRWVGNVLGMVERHTAVQNNS